MNRARRQPCVRPARAGGFTLLEVLVVMIVIAVLTVMVVLQVSLTGIEKQLGEEARRMAALIRLASDEAVLQGQDMGLRIREGRYEFLTFSYEHGAWLQIEDDTVFKAREFPRGSEPQLLIDDVEVEIDKVAIDESGKVIDNPPPQIAIFTSGELTPFVLRLHHDDATQRIDLTGEPTGATIIESHDVVRF